MKHLGTKIRLIAALPLLLMGWSCSDDAIYRGADELSDNEMHFSSRVSSVDTKSRADNDNLECFTADKCENSDIYLVTTIEDGIDGTKLDSYDKDAEKKVYEAMSMAQSRAAQLTAPDLVSSYLQTNGYSIGLYAYKYPKKDSYNGQTTSNYDYKLSDVISEFGADSLNIVKFIEGESLSYGSSSDDKNTVSLTASTKHYWDKYDTNCMTFLALFPTKTDYAKISSGTSDTYTMLMYHNYAKIKFQMDTDPANQVDFLYAQKNCLGNGSSTSNNIPLEMQHIMTGINVTLGDGFSGYKIKYVRFGGIDTSNKQRAVNAYGIFDLAKGEWEALPNGQKYSRNLEYTCSNASEQTANLDGKLFMAIPQKLGTGQEGNGNITADCYITITVVSPTGTEETYNKNLTGTEWPQGKTVNYQLSTTRGNTKYFITTEYSVMKYGWNGEPAGNGTSYTDSQKHTIDDVGYIRVKSYKRTITGGGTTADTTYTDVPWTATEGSTTIESTSAAMVSDSYKKDYRTHSSTNNVNYDFDMRDFNFMFKHTIGRQTANTTAKPSQDKIKINNLKTYVFGDNVTADNSTTKRVDLSLYKQEVVTRNGKNVVDYWYKSSTKTTTYKGRETSNCYMIKYPGNYVIPCVYGNGIHYNEMFTTAYQNMTSTKDYDGRALNNLVAHNNMALNSNWINNTCGEVPTKAISVWQDSPNLVTNLGVYSLSTGNDGEFYLKFDVSADNIKPGNAVIAVTNTAGMILWSWHIWVTPSASNDKFTVTPSSNGSMSSRQFLNVPLGFVEGDTIQWAARTKTLTLVQKEDGVATGQTATVTLQQDEHLLPQNHCCYYQWGRKDPFPGAIVSEDQTNGGAMDYNGQYATTTTQVPLYNLNYGANSVRAVAEQKLLGEYVQLPYWYYCQQSTNNSNAFPPGHNYIDLWGCTQLYTTVAYGAFDSTIGTFTKKTIYDPCPIEFKVPPIHAFPRFSENCNNFSTGKSDWAPISTTESEIFAKLNTPFSSISDFVNDAGMTFYCNAMTNGATNSGGGTFKLPAFGYIDPISSGGKGNDGSLVYRGVGEAGWYWSNSRAANSATLPTGQFVYNIMFRYTGGVFDMYQVYGNTECRGEPVLPMYDDTNPVW